MWRGRKFGFLPVLCGPGVYKTSPLAMTEITAAIPVKKKVGSLDSLAALVTGLV